jgi:UDP-N-acetylglucosamine 2-epimerase
MRTRTEWVETVEQGFNFLSGYETERILQTAAHIEEEWGRIKNNLRRPHFLFGKPPISPNIADVVETMSGK